MSAVGEALDNQDTAARTPLPGQSLPLNAGSTASNIRAKLATATKRLDVKVEVGI